MFGLVGFALEVGFEFDEFGVVGGLDTEDGTGKDEEFADYADGGVGDFAGRRDEEETGAGDGHAGGEAGYGHCALESCELPLCHSGHRMRIPVDTRSPIPVISVQSVGELQHRRLY